MSTLDFALEAGGCCSAGAPKRTLPRFRFLGVCAALFLGSAAGIVYWGTSMTMGDMPMPGGWVMSMAWMRMPGQTWPAAAASFLGMWTLMMVAMMMPSLVPMLWRYRQAVFAANGQGIRLGGLSLLVGAGYFLVWAAQGAVVFPLGVALAAAAMRWPALARAAPLAVGVVVLAAGVLQMTPWKARHLACCRGGRSVPHADPRTAWRHGLRLGLHCGACCAGLTAVLLAMGVMNLAVMGAVTVAVSAERLAFAGARVARAVGAALVAVALFLIARST